MPLDAPIGGHDFRGVADQSRNQDVGVAFQHDDVLHGGLDQYIAIEPGKGVGVDEIVRYAIPDDAGSPGTSRPNPLYRKKSRALFAAAPSQSFPVLSFQFYVGK